MMKIYRLLTVLLAAMLSCLVFVPAASAATLSLIGKKYADSVSDTFLYAYRSTTCYDGYSTASVGRTGYGEQRMLLRFPLAKLAGPTVTDARLHLTRSGGSTGFTLRAYRLTRPDTVWNQATWNQAATGVAWGSPGAGGAGVDFSPATYCESTSFTDFDVTDLVRDAVAAGETTIDLLVVDPTPTAGRYLSVYSSEISIADWAPMLEVTSR
jgi:hypothetical protein